MAKIMDDGSFVREASTPSIAFKIRRRSHSAPAATRRRRSRIEEHYLVDTERNVVLPGVPSYDDDLARDLHDFFNLIVLIPVVVLNGLNWRWDILLDYGSEKTLQEAWVGEWNNTFYRVVILYFFVDLVWVLIVPHCVKSPATIVTHHILCLIYCTVPLFVPGTYYIMGLNMSVEANTWFLIARRVFNKQGLTPWTISLPPLFSIRVKLVSILFYLTWVLIRVIIYPVLVVRLVDGWQSHTELLGTKFNAMLFALLFQIFLCGLNLKWTRDLIVAKIRFWNKKNAPKYL